MKPVLYSPTDTDFTAGGIGILSDCKKCLVTEEANGSYTVELSFPNVNLTQRMLFIFFIFTIIIKIWLQDYYMFTENLEL